MEYEAACGAPIRICTELYGSATSVWIKVSAQSEPMGPSSAGFAPAPPRHLAAPERICTALQSTCSCLLPLRHHDPGDWFGRPYHWWTCEEPQREAQPAQFIAQRCRWPCV